LQHSIARSDSLWLVEPSGGLATDQDW